jgi:hypothetical protein
VIDDLLRDYSLCKLAHTFEAVITQNRHDARNHRHCDARFTAVLDPFVEDVIVVKKLGDYEVSASINFCLQVFYVVGSRSRAKVDLGVASHTDGEKITVIFSDKSDQIYGIIKSVFIVDPVICASGWVASEGQQISDAHSLRLIKAFDDLLSRHKRASDVHQYINAHVFLDVRTQFEGDVRCHTACVPSYVYPKWVSLRHAVNSINQIFEALLCLRWEIFKRVVALLGFIFAGLVRAWTGVEDVVDFFRKFH